MSEELENKETVAKPKGEEKPGIARRDIVTALASVPVFGAFFATFFGKKARDDDYALHGFLYLALTLILVNVASIPWT